MRRSRRTLAGAATVLAASAAVAWLAWPATLGGGTSYVATHGVSMEPRFHTGDLAVLRPSTAYRVGDVVAYRSQLLHTVVMHRIVAVNSGHYTFKGDNNSWVDPETPDRARLVGKLALRIPDGAVWLHRATSPGTLAAAMFLLLVGGGTTVQTRRRRRRRTMSRHAAARTRSNVRLTSLSPQLLTAMAATAAVGLLALALGVLAWTGPLTSVARTTSTSARSMVFSYTATVPKSAAYDTTTVSSPDPIFRKLTNVIAVHYSYRGTPGSMDVDATLSSPSGWRSTVPLVARTTVTGDRYDGSVNLHLDTLDARAQAAAAATGIPAGPVTVTIRPTVHSSIGDFTPALPLTLTPLQLTLATDARNLTVTDSTSLTNVSRVPRAIGAAGHTIRAETARRVSIAMLLVTALGALLLLQLGRRSSAGSEAARIRRRYADLLVEVAPMPTPAGRPVVDVATFATLARLAERYGLLVLHWARSDVDTFVVQDDATTYRYRTGSIPVDHEQLHVTRPSVLPRSS